MEQLKIPLGNGYNLVALNGADPDRPLDMHICITDADDVFNQDIVIVRYDHAQTDGQFEVLVFADKDAEDYTDAFTVGLHHDPDIDEDETDEDDTDVAADDETDGGGDEVEEADGDEVVLQFGDKGEDVKTIQRQLKALGYFTGSIGGNYLSLTEAAVRDFQLQAGLHVDGICDAATRSAMMKSTAPHKPVESDGEKSADGRHPQSVDWWKSDIQKIFAKGVTATITDVDTGLQWQEQRRGGTNHADVQPLTATDTTKLKKAYGGKWSWSRRAIIVSIGGKHYAASMNGMPHGGSSIKNNNFDGHHCIHFTNSRTHGSNKVCPNHQAAIRKACAATI